MNRRNRPKTLKSKKSGQAKIIIETKVYSEQEDEEMLKLYEGLRVADVTWTGWTKLA